jgi:SAM-dependent methyltransferase
MTGTDLRTQLEHPRYPRSSGYDAGWIVANQMGPHPLWLMEALVQHLPLEPGMRVLDIGCGRALTSIFLAREFDVEVWATDLWIDATDNLARITEAGAAGRVLPVHAEAHALPYADGFFDAIVSVDAYQYFGTADLYLGYITRFLRPGGRIGMVAPAVLSELGATVPDHLAPYWDWEFCCFHGPDWWRTHWAKTGKVDVEVADALPDGWSDWLRWEEAVGPHLPEHWREASARTQALLRADRGRLLGFTRIVAGRR